MAEQDLTIDAPVQHVWDQIVDPWMYTGWVVGSSHIRGVDPTWPQVGSKVYHEVGGWPLTIKDHTEVLELEPPRRVVLKARGWPLGEARVSLELSDAGGRTRVVMDEEPIAGPGRWLDNPLSERVLALRVKECLQRLSSIAEHRH